MISSEGSPGEEQPVVVRFTGEIDAARVGLDHELLSAAGKESGGVVVDLVDVTFIDSSFVRALVLAHQAVTEEGRWLRLVYTHHVIGRVIDICGLSELLPQYATVDAAVRDHRVTPVAAGGDPAGGSPGGGRR